jgi:hypothetical protein
MFMFKLFLLPLRLAQTIAVAISELTFVAIQLIFLFIPFCFLAAWCLLYVWSFGGEISGSSQWWWLGRLMQVAVFLSTIFFLLAIVSFFTGIKNKDKDPDFNIEEMKRFLLLTAFLFAVADFIIFPSIVWFWMHWHPEYRFQSVLLGSIQAFINGNAPTLPSLPKLPSLPSSEGVSKAFEGKETLGQVINALPQVQQAVVMLGTVFVIIFLIGIGNRYTVALGVALFVVFIFVCIDAYNQWEKGHRVGFNSSAPVPSASQSMTATPSGVGECRQYWVSRDNDQLSGLWDVARGCGGRPVLVFIASGAETMPFDARHSEGCHAKFPDGLIIEEWSNAGGHYPHTNGQFYGLISTRSIKISWLRSSQGASAAVVITCP